MTVISPGDPIEARLATKAIIAITALVISAWVRRVSL
jgi:hypothetical protein